MSLFQLSTPALIVGLFAVIIGATVIGHLLGRSMRDRSEGLREPFGAIQSAMLGFMALVMAFGLSLAVGRYESRRAAVVTEANALGTAYLRAQTLAEPNRTPSLDLMRRLTDASDRHLGDRAGQSGAAGRAGEQQRGPTRPLGPGRPGDHRAAERERAPPLPRQPQRGLRRPDGPRIGPGQPGPDAGPPARDGRGRSRARTSRPPSRDPGPRSGHRPARGGPRRLHAVHHLRPRPSGPRPHQRARRRPDPAAHLHGRPAGVRRPR